MEQQGKTGEKKLVIIGAGEFAEIACEYFTYDSDYDVVCFSVEKEFMVASPVAEIPIISFEDLEKNYSPLKYEVFIAIPASELNRLRTRFYEKCKKMGYQCASYISSKAFVWRNAQIGDNCFIFEHNTVQPFVKIGNNVILWSGNHIGHRTVVEDNCFISSHVVISGYCRIGSGSFIGVNSTFNDHTMVASNCIVASGALVNKPLIEPEKVYFGSPAKPFPNKSSFSIKL